MISASGLGDSSSSVRISGPEAVAAPETITKVKANAASRSGMALGVDVEFCMEMLTFVLELRSLGVRGSLRAGELGVVWVSAYFQSCAGTQAKESKSWVIVVIHDVTQRGRTHH